MCNVIMILTSRANHVLSLNYRSQPSFRALARSSHSQRPVLKVAVKIKTLSPSLEFLWNRILNQLTLERNRFKRNAFLFKEAQVERLFLGRISSLEIGNTYANHCPAHFIKNSFLNTLLLQQSYWRENTLAKLN